MYIVPYFGLYSTIGSELNLHISVSRMSDFIEDLLSTYDAAGPAACSSSFLKGLLKELRRSKVTHCRMFYALHDKVV